MTKFYLAFAIAIIAAVSVMGQCNSISAEYTQSFDLFPLGGMSGNTIECWTNENTINPQWTAEDLTTGTSLTGPSGPQSGARYIFLETSQSSAGQSDTLTSPSIDISAFSTVELSFFYHMYGQSMGSLRFEASGDQGSSWDLLGEIVGEQHASSAAAWTERIESLSAYSSTVIIRFIGIRGINFYSDMALDEIKIRSSSSCPPPTSISVIDRTSTSAEINWVIGGAESDWVVSYGTTGTTPNNGIKISSASTNQNITGISGSYDAYVRAVCNPGDSSSWLGPISFTTAPVNYNCDNASSIQCGSQVVVSTEFAVLQSTLENCGTEPGGKGIWYKYVGDGHEVTLSTDFPETNFDTKINVYRGDCSELICVAGDDDSGANSTSIVTFPSSSNSTYFIYVSGFSNNIGDFKLNVSCVDCFDPLDLKVYNIASTSADVEWISPYGSTSFVMEYGIDGFSLGSGTQVTTGNAGGPLKITGLNESTDYDVYVWETCGGQQTATIGPISFGTVCGVNSPYETTFLTYLPACWQEADFGNPNTGPNTLGTSSWGNDAWLNDVGHANGNSARINIFFINSDWLISPVFDLSTGVNTLIFDIGSTEYNTMLPAVWATTDTVQLLMTTDDGNSWDVVQTWDYINPPSNTGDSISIDLSGISGTIQFAFWGSTGGIDTPADIEVFVDNFEMKQVLNDPPQANCQNIIAYLNASGDLTVLANQIDDGTSVGSLSVSQSMFSCLDIGPQTIKLYASTNVGLDSCTAVVNVLDTFAPVISCVDTTLYLDINGDAIIEYDNYPTSVTDNCGIDTAYLTQVVFNQSHLGANPDTIVAIDENGNTNFCVVNIQVIDTFVVPVADCQNATIYLNETGTIVLDPASINNGSVGELSINDSSFSCINIGTNQVTLYATTNGGVDSCLATVTIVDSLAPILICTDTVLYLDINGDAIIEYDNYPTSVTDNCGIDTAYLAQVVFNQSHLGANPDTIVAIDENGNTNFCVVNVQVIDTFVVPVADCQNATIYLNETGTIVLNPSSINNESVGELSISDSSFSCVNIGANQVTLYATTNGGVDSCLATVTIVDSLAPILICTDTVLYLDINGDAIIEYDNYPTSVTDNCGIDTAYLTQVAFNQSHLGANPDTIVAIDENGNTNFCVVNIQVIDTFVVPVADCQNATIYLNETGTIVLDPASINNGSVGELSISDSSFSCINIGINQVTLYATTNGGVDSCVATVTIVDSLASILICTDTTLYLDINGDAIIEYDNYPTSVTDNCGIDTAYLTQVLFNQSHLGANLDTIVAIDENGNTNFCVVNVQVIDTFVVPVADCQNATIYLNETGTIVLDPASINNGSVGELSVSDSSFSCINIGINQVTLYATTNGGVDSCVATVTIVDSLAPILICTDTTLYLDINGDAIIEYDNYPTSVTDNCGIDTAYLTQVVFNHSHLGANPDTIVAIDENGNTNFCVVNVQVIDTFVVPVADCQNATIYLNETGTIVLNPASINNESVGELSISDSSFSCVNIGTNQVTLYATTNVGVDTCLATVTIVDSLAPILICTDTTLYLDINGDAIIEYDNYPTSVTDNCGIDTAYLTQVLFNQSHLGANPDTIVAIDENGNTNFCVVNVQVIDTFVVPVADCQNATIYLNETGTIVLDPASINNASVGELSVSDSSFSCINIGMNQVTLYATTNVGVDTCLATVTIVDSLAPILICTDTTLYLDINGNALIEYDNYPTSVTDNCGIDTAYLTQVAFNQSHLGANPDTIVAIDENGNANFCVVNVQMIDTFVVPVADCQNATIYLNETGTIVLDPASINNASVGELSVSDSSFSCINIGMNQVTLYATTNGGVDSCLATVTIVDSLAPILICTDTVLYLDINGDAIIEYDNYPNSVTDNCGIDTAYLTQVAFNQSHLGANPDTIVAIDENGNTNFCVVNVQVIDTFVVPVADCQNATIYLNETGTIVLDPASINNGSVGELSVSDSSFSCINIGINQVTLYATTNGGVDSCVATVTIVDSLAPILICTDTTLYLDINGDAIIEYDNYPTSVTDNCGIDTAYLTQVVFNQSHLGANPDTIVAIDENGNTNFCVVNIQVIDTFVVPVADCQNATIYLNETGTIVLDPASINNASVGELSVSDSSFSCINIGMNQVTLYATTNVGVDSCLATVTIVDSLAPILICTDTTLYLDINGDAIVEYDNYPTSVTDNCGIDTAYLTQVIFNHSHLGANPDTIVAIDENGNTNFCVVNVQVIDTFVVPVADCQNATIYLNETGTIVLDPASINNGSVGELSVSDSSFSCVNIGTNQVTLYATTNLGVDSCIASVNVLDSMKPIIYCSDTTLYLNIDSTAVIAFANYASTTSDNCGLDTAFLSQAEFNYSHLGNNVDTIFAMDESGNSNLCILNVNVEDTILRTNVKLRIQEALSPSACGDVSDYSSGILCFDVYLETDETNWNLQSYTVWMSYGPDNSVLSYRSDASCSHTNGGSINLDEFGKYRFLGSSSTLPLVVNQEVKIHNFCVDIVDLAGVDGLKISAGGDFFGLQSSASLSKQSNVNNTRVSGLGLSSLTLNIIAPLASCADTTIYLDSSGASNITPLHVDGGSIGILSMNESELSCLDLGNNELLLFAATLGGVDSCLATITVSDTLSPILNCSDTILYLDINGSVTIEYDNYPISVFDNCGIDTAYLTKVSFNQSHVGLNVDTIVAIDISGNSSFCAVDIDVIDTFVMPEATCQDVTIYLNSVGIVDIVPAVVDNGSVGELSISDSSFSCSTIGLQQVKLYANTNAGIDTCLAMINIVDTIAPLVGCSDTFLVLDSNNMAVLDASSCISAMFDNCQIDSFFLSKDTFNQDDLGITLDTLTVIDASGNQSVCVFEVSVLPAIDPCTQFLSFTNNHPQGTFQADTIESTALIEASKVIIYKIETLSCLLPSFEVELGADFEVIIEDCD